MQGEDEPGYLVAVGPQTPAATADAWDAAGGSSIDQQYQAVEGDSEDDVLQRLRPTFADPRAVGELKPTAAFSAASGALGAAAASEREAEAQAKRLLVGGRGVGGGAGAGGGAGVERQGRDQGQRGGAPARAAAAAAAKPEAAVTGGGGGVDASLPWRSRCGSGREGCREGGRKGGRAG